MNDILLKNITKSFEDKKVINNFSLSIPKGSKICLMGESGCGKTTLLNIIMGLITPDEGVVEITGKPISVVFQEDRLCESFSAVGNIRAVVGNSVSDSEILNCLDLLGLKGNKNVPVSTLSGGMRRRVAIARALLVKSQLIIMDEPFNGLDDANRKNAVEVILSYAKDKTIILATHNPNDAQLLGAEIINL